MLFKALHFFILSWLFHSYLFSSDFLPTIPAPVDLEEEEYNDDIYPSLPQEYVFIPVGFDPNKCTPALRSNSDPFVESVSTNKRAYKRTKKSIITTGPKKNAQRAMSAPEIPSPANSHEAACREVLIQKPTTFQKNGEPFTFLPGADIVFSEKKKICLKNIFAGPYSELDFSDHQFSRCKLTNGVGENGAAEVFTACTFNNCMFILCEMSARFQYCIFSNCIFIDSDFQGCQMYKCSFQNVFVRSCDRFNRKTVAGPGCIFPLDGSVHISSPLKNPQPMADDEK